MRKPTIELIFKVAKEKNAFEIIEKHFSEISISELSENIIEFGILPEMFGHDSSEEKIWAKVSDIILARTLGFIGINSKVLGTRGNSADVYGETKDYTIVGDAKTSRLSNTHSNPKDYKIDAVNNWRNENTYALIVAPLYKFSKNKSQIYFQAIEKNVTLFSYTHLHFLLDYYNGQSLKPIWETGNKLKEKLNSNYSDSKNYWTEIDKIVASTLNKEIKDLEYYKNLEVIKTKDIGLEGIKYWKEKINQFHQLSKEEAIKLLIKSEKIENKIKTIEKVINFKL